MIVSCIVSCIVAVADNNVIGKKNDLPWHLPADLRRFKKMTMGHTIIMGRKTYESIGRPLPGRTSVVITRDRDYSRNGTIVVHSLEEALDRTPDEEEVFIVGGESIFELALPRSDRIYLTRVHATFEGDVFFPAAALEQFRLVEEERHRADEKNPHDYSFRTDTRLS